MALKGKYINLWLPEGYRQRIVLLMDMLTTRGVDLRDQRGNNSISALLRYLVEQEEQRQNQTRP